VALQLATVERREKLQANVKRLRTGLQELGIHALGDAHVVPIVLGAQTMQVADSLLSHGFWAAGIRAPTVPAGSERIRITLSAEHTAEQIDTLLECLSVTLMENRHD
jgi:7-keto-8-aminopelargonate synthetase-like enzyme